MKIVLPERLYFRSLLGAIGQDDQNAVTVDDSALRVVMPSGLAGLAAILAREQAGNKPIDWTPTSTNPAVAYMAKMELFAALGIPYPETFAPTPENHAFARLSKIQWNDDTSRVADRLTRMFRHHAPEIHSDMFTCIEESIRNIVDHAQAPGFAAAQARDMTGTGDRKYALGICDCGRGVLEGLRENPDLHPASARQALEWACQRGISGAIYRNPHDQMNFGMGLFHIDQKVADCGGEFILCSGDCARIRQGKRVTYETIPPFFGTSIEITLHASNIPNASAPTPRRRLLHVD